uniref:Galectin n=1 Tax=Monodelphis domestica TaxID=13616 RepID=A0A5F8HFT5_MONDO
MNFIGGRMPYLSPLVPFSGPIQGGLQDGLEITINGMVLPSSGNRFDVNFQLGTSGNDIAFHFNPRFEDGGYVVCNTKQNGCWGKEERKGPMPFQRGALFEIRFQVQNASFKVMVNGNYFAEYQHRIPFQWVDTITVNGMVQLAYISFTVRTSDISLLHHFFSLSELRSHWVVSLITAILTTSLTSYLLLLQILSHLILTLSLGGGCSSLIPILYYIHTYIPKYHWWLPFNLPFRASVYGGLHAGKFLLVLGSILPTADSFEINLRSGNDIAFHLNPRFQENTIVRNSHINYLWGPEERALSSVMPFIKGQTFMVLITCEAQGFKVTVNGQYLFSYSHRVKNLSSINQLEVAGDIQLTHVQV